MAISLIAVGWLFIVFFGLCVWEEATVTKRPVRKSRIWLILLNLALEVAQAAIRIALRACWMLRIESPPTLLSWYLQIMSYAQTVSLQKPDEKYITSRLWTSQMSSLRATIQYTVLLEAQTELLHAKSELLHQRRDNHNASTQDIDEQRDRLLGATERAGEQFERLSAQIARERRKIDDHEQANLTLRKINPAHERILDLLARLQKTRKARVGLFDAISGLDAARQALYKRVDETQQQLRNTEKLVVDTRRQQDLIYAGSKALELRRLLLIQRLVFAVLVLFGFSRTLGERLAPALRLNNNLVSRWRTLSQEKVQSRRELLRALNVTADLRDQLDFEQSRRADTEHAALCWQAKYVLSIDQRDIVVKKFNSFKRLAATRFCSTTTTLLTGLLILWRLNLFLSQRLAEVTNILRAIEEASDETPVDAGPSSARIEDIPTPVLDSPIPSQLSGPSVTSPVIGHVDSSIAPRDTADEPNVQAFDPVLASTPALQTFPRRFESCAVDTYDLPKATVEIGIMTEPTIEEKELRERVQRLHEKVKAMEAIDAVYRGMLINGTKPESIPVHTSKEQLSSGGASFSPASTLRGRRPTMLGGSSPFGKGKPSRIFSQPLEKFPLAPSNPSNLNGVGPSTPLRVSDSPTVTRPPFLLNAGNISFF